MIAPLRALFRLIFRRSRWCPTDAELLAWAQRCMRELDARAYQYSRQLDGGAADCHVVDSGETIGALYARACDEAAMWRLVLGAVQPVGLCPPGELAEALIPPPEGATASGEPAAPDPGQPGDGMPPAGGRTLPQGDGPTLARLRLAHDLARYAVESSEVLDDSALQRELGPDQVAKLRGVCRLGATAAELLAGRRPLPTLLEVSPTTEAALLDQLQRAGDAITSAYDLPWPRLGPTPPLVGDGDQGTFSTGGSDELP